MSSSHFQIRSHVVPGQHIREYPRAAIDEQEAIFRLAVKQYTPLDNLNPQPGDLTIIGAHANGFPKELYEPLWDELLLRSKQQGFRIRGIWIADVAQQGQSGVLNEDILGNDPCWNDHSRDLLQVINHFRAEMPRPLMAIGHSMGGNHLTQTALLHPRLFASLILLDPVIQREPSEPPSGEPPPTQLSTFRRDLWPSRAVARTSFMKNPFYQKWDPRVIDAWVEHGFRDLPTPLYPDSPQTPDPSTPATADTTPVTLTTTKHQEVFTFLRPNWDVDPVTKKPIRSREAVPDWDPTQPNTTPFYRPEPIRTLIQLPFLRPSVLWVFGGDSPMSTPKACEEKLQLCGTGVGGSGGLKEGRVKGVVLDGIGHLVAMEAVGQCADAATEWIGVELRKWRESEARFIAHWGSMTRQQKSQISEKYKEMMGGDPRKGKFAKKAEAGAVATSGKRTKL